ncbi:glycoside hydrolase family 28 protein [Caulobacter sp. 602-2]|uniref:Glycoside hydrolase family 28 protein n=1 Tax=Caulobacter sp. 602-2 TaxID=2710887 RepID=A0A6G4QZI8_9CAUL|nr:glycoside hydrolase family 28 protein [Caulobacter sp. 602-2]NGM50869.1 glycoside hydrolase family 28 protein [Caulobacter sp. 602-2]
MTGQTSRRALLTQVAAAALTGLLPSSVLAAERLDPWARARWIAKTVRAPAFPKRDFPVTQFGAKGDGLFLNTSAFAAAIEACAKAGGGRVVVPAGRYLTGAIRLKSNVNLHVTEGATLLFSTEPTDYPIVFTRWEGTEAMNYSPLIYAYKERNIAITGEGTIDGQASPEHWWSWKGRWGGKEDYGWRPGMPDQKPSRAALFKMAEDGVPVEQRVMGEGHYLRPPTIQPYDCENVLIEGVQIRRSPFWNIHPVLCRNVIVRGVDVMSHGPNNDGCDPESCDLMVIEDCVFDTGDDCIAIDSGRDADGRRLATPSQNILIRNCTMRRGHGGLVIGSVIAGGVHHVFAENCELDSPDLMYAIRFKNNAARGGLLEHFYYRDIKVGQVSHAVITCDFNYEEGARGKFKPILRHVRIERLTAKRAFRVIDSQGLPDAPVTDIELRDCRFEGVTAPSVIAFTEGLKLANVKVNGDIVASL